MDAIIQLTAWSQDLKTVSVILTTYNSEKVIQRTLDSIYRQDGINTTFLLELIVVDDFSTDGTVDILKQNPLIQLSTEVNSGGPNRGRNMGLDVCGGDYICIADHDDEWHTDRIITLLPFLEKVPIVTSGYTLVDSESSTKIVRLNAPLDNTSSSNYYPRNVTFLKKLSRISDGQIVYMGNIIFRKELNDIRFEEVYGAVDFDWIIRLFHERDSIEVCESLYTRHVDGSNLSLYEKYRLKDHAYSLEVLQEYKSTYPEEVRQGIQKTHGTLARYYYVTGQMKKARRYFLKAGLDLKTLLYFVTTFGGSGLVKKYFKVFG